MVKNLGSIILIIGVIFFFGFIWLLFSAVQEGNEFSSCLNQLAISGCEEKGFTYFSHENAIDFDNAISKSYTCGIIDLPFKDEHFETDNFQSPETIDGLFACSN